MKNNVSAFITVLVKEPGELPQVKRILNHHTVLSDIVGGCFDIAHIDRRLVAIVHDESAINGMDYNCTLNGYHLFGTVILASTYGQELYDVPGYLLAQLGLYKEAQIITFLEAKQLGYSDKDIIKYYGQDYELYREEVERRFKLNSRCKKA